MVEQIKMLCKSNNISIKALERTLGFGNGTVRRWDTHTPGHDKLVKVADYFNVSIEYLLGDSEQKEKAPVGSIDKGVEEFNKLFSSLPPEVQARELAYLRELVNELNK